MLLDTRLLGVVQVPESEVEDVVAGLAAMMGNQLVCGLRTAGRERCADKISDFPFGLSFGEAEELVVMEEKELMRQIDRNLTPKQEAVLLVRFYRGVNEAADGVVASMAVERAHRRAQLLSEHIAGVE